VKDGTFESPLADNLPENSKHGYVQLILPDTFANGQKIPLCILFTSFGDTGNGFRRNNLAVPLVKYNIASLILENPFYGKRKPDNQIKGKLKTVQDFVTMASATIYEGRALVNWASNSKKEQGDFFAEFSPICVSGMSMGASMSQTIGATPFDFPLVVVPSLAAFSSADIFAYENACLTHSVDWDKLRDLPAELSKSGTPVRVSHKEAMQTLYTLLRKSGIDQFPITTKHPLIFTQITAKYDKYIPQVSAKANYKYWSDAAKQNPNVETNEIEIDGGHVTSFFLHVDNIVEAIREAIVKMQRKLYQVL